MMVLASGAVSYGRGTPVLGSPAFVWGLLGSDVLSRMGYFLENATDRGCAWYKLLDAPVLTVDVTV